MIKELVLARVVKLRMVKLESLKVKEVLREQMLMCKKFKELACSKN